jgi:Tfp pilus assembly PilM family ATPase
MVQTTPLRPTLRRYVTPRTRLLGVDLGSRAAKVVVCQRKGNSIRIEAALRFVYPAEVVGSPAQQIALLGPWLRSCGIEPLHRVACALAPAQFNYDSAPITSGATDLDTFASSSLEELLGAPANKVTYDYWSTTDVSLKGPASLHLAWSSTELMTEIAQAFRGLGATCELIQVGPTLLASSVANAAVGAKLAIELGHDSLSLTLLHNHQPVLLRHRIPAPLDETLQHLCAELGLERQAAEYLLAHRGIDPTHDSALAMRIEAGISRWREGVAYEIRRTRAYIERKWGTLLPQQIVLYGGGAEIRGLDKWLETQCLLPVSYLELPPGCQWEAAIPFSPSFAIAARSAFTGVSR